MTTNLMKKARAWSVMTAGALKASLIATLATLGVSGVSAAAYAGFSPCGAMNDYSYDYSSVVPTGSISIARSTDPVGPFPLSALLPFPWSTIEGIWTARLPDGMTIYMSFEVLSDCEGDRYLNVQYFNPKTTTVIAQGTGIAQGGDQMVRAVMTSSTSQYMIFVRQFKNSSQRSAAKTATVITIRPFNSNGSDDIHVVARKVANMTLEAYFKKQRDAEAATRRTKAPR